MFLVTTNLRIVINSGWLYTSGFERWNVSEANGIEPEELDRIAREFKAYFNNDVERLQVVATVQGQERPLFNEREIAHMVDVKGMVQGLRLWQIGSFFLMVGIAVGGLFLAGRPRILPVLARGLFGGALFTIATIAALGIGSLVGFDALFTQFHIIGFSNDLWLLDPRTDYLVRIFPQGFFLDATLIVAGLTIAQAALTATAAGGYLWVRQHRERAAA